ncbi:MAG: hypothetical protein ACXADC_12695 [Candidatus Thorarchaeota archaeon]
MTAQIPDEFRYMGALFSLAGIKGSALYTPQDFGITPLMASTACYRGYVMRYDCVNGQLVLESMSVRTEDALPVNNIEPHEEGGYFFSHRYEGLGLKTKFTGAILLAKDFIDGMYVHMGFQRPMAYRTVLELQIQDGDILATNDLSAKMEELRNRDPTKDAQPDSRENADVMSWIEGSFSLDYDIE